MSFHPRRILPPGASKKRKEGESFYNPAPLPIKRARTNPNPKPKPSPSHSVKPLPLPDVLSAPAQAKGEKSPDNPAIDNRLLAGYMAHEFLTRGTILGQQFDPVRAEAVAVEAEPRRMPGVAEPSQSRRKGKEKEVEAKDDKKLKRHPSYADVTSMLKTEGPHIPGVVNPSQLVKWLRQ